MFNYLRTGINQVLDLTKMQWYSLAIFFWFAIARWFALSNTDDIARNFMHNPFTFIIAIISAIYAIMILCKIYPSNERFIKFAHILFYIHSYFMLYRGYVYLFKTHSLADFGYLSLDSFIALYFLLTLNICMGIVKNGGHKMVSC